MFHLILLHRNMYVRRIRMCSLSIIVHLEFFHADETVSNVVKYSESCLQFVRGEFCVAESVFRGLFLAWSVAVNMDRLQCDNLTIGIFISFALGHLFCRHLVGDLKSVNWNMQKQILIAQCLEQQKYQCLPKLYPKIIKRSLRWLCSC